MTLQQTYNKRIDRGVEFLDKTFGRKKWLRKIKVKKLNMKLGLSCICGQMFGDFWSILLGNVKGQPRQSIRWAISNGLFLGEKKKESYDLLTQLWKVRIRKLRRGK